MGMDRHCRSAAIRSIAALIYIVDFCASNALERPPPKRRMQADPCEDLDCGAHGSCHAGECVCSDFYRGTFCHITPSLCDGVWCSSAGTCVDGACHCDVGVTGDTCEVSEDPCAHVSCGLHGSCHGGRCICNNWFEGVDCTAPSVPAADDYFHSLTSAGARASGGAVSGQANTAEECIETGTTSFVSSDLEFVSDTSGALSCSEQLVGVRFEGVLVPAGATIHSSRISFTVDEVQPESLQPLTIIIRAQASDNAPAFRQDENDISDRSTLSTAVDWVIDEWLTVGDSISTVEVGVLVQEIIQRSGWMAGNAILFTFGYVSGQGTRWAKADDPSIVISYTVTESNSFDPCWGVDCGPSSTGRCVSGLCQCTSGYTGAACQTPPDLCQYMSCGVRSTHCVSGECLCEPGWAGNTCEIDVSAPNPCAYVSCGLHGRCVVGLCDCTDGYSGAACENRPDFCAGVVCSNGGTCVDGACACTSLYRGTRCETRDIDLCSLDCGNHGTCVAGSCLCEEGWTGPSCTQVGSSPCHFTSCGAHGTCSVNGTQATCVCTDGYSGDNCEDGPDPCQVLDCGVHGECDTISVSCACAEGWTGPSCAIAIDPCEGITCGEHGFCTHGTCTCIDFYQGVRCEIVPDPCRTAECAPYGLCREESGACECFYGYTGDHCEVAPSLCDSIDCENGHCIGDACICNDFYHGERCEIAPAPLCFGVLCGNNGICNPATGKCDCTEGFHGYLCEIRRGPCHDIDCGDNGRCASGACICTNFYTGMLCDTPPTTAATFVSAALHYSVQVSDATHTAEECASGGGTVTVHSSDLELPTDTDGRCAEQIVGIRFAAVHLPAGTSIQSVQIQFIVDEVRAESSFPISLKISVEETDDASSFEHGSVASISRRNMLGTTVLWAADSWPVTGAAVQTPDLSSLVSAILTRPGWAVGNAMVFTFSHWTGQGIRWARSDSPSLVVRYTADDNLWNACAAIDCGFHGRCLSGFCECTDGYTGLACKTPPDLCASVTCESGLCIEGRCNCIAGFGGAFCDTAVVEDPCSGIECGSRGRCTDSSHGCLCTDGYSGRNCEIEPDLCAELSCGVHSTGCVQGVCVCEDGWIGTTCSTNNVCGGVSCGPQGECIAGTCHCTAGFSGSNCELPPAGACEYIDCGSHGECLESLCVCSSGYRGQRCTEVDPCHDMDCNSHGNCSEGSCVCTEAYAGPSCSLCAPGFIEYPNCIDDPCDPEICNGHGLCERNSVTCFCDAGFRGHDCSSCSDGYIEYPRCREDPCSPEKCSGHGICNRTGNGSCTCDANFAGADCSSCSPGFYGYPNCIDDPCDPNPCSGWSRCAVDGSCSCILGYSGLACDIVPLHPCDGVTCSERGTCVNGTCACEEGYAGLECESCASGFISVSNGALPDRSSSAPFCRVEVCISHCNGRGTCVAGLCDCDNEYAGPDCSECSEGFSGYPDCVPSAQQLSVAQLPIAGTHKIRGRISVGTTIDEIPIGSTLRSEFVESLQRLLAQKMDEAGLTTSVDQISVISILSGSVVVIFEIVATSTSDATTRALEIEAARQYLQTRIATGSLTILTARNAYVVESIESFEGTDETSFFEVETPATTAEQPTESEVVVIIVVLSTVVGTVVVILACLLKWYWCKSSRKGAGSHSVEESESAKAIARVKTRTVDENEEEVALREWSPIDSLRQ